MSDAEIMGAVLEQRVRASLRLSNNHVEHLDLDGRWYPTAAGFTYEHPVRFVVDCPDLDLWDDTSGAWVERLWLTFADGTELDVPLGGRYAISGPAATFTAYPITVGVQGL